MSPPDIELVRARRVQAFELAETLPQLLLQAEALDESDILAMPASLITRDARLDRWSQEQIARIGPNLGVSTIADLLSPGRVQGLLGQLSRSARQQLLKVAREVLISGPDRATLATASLPRIEDPPATPQELRDWASERGVADLLGLHVRSLPALAGLLDDIDDYGLHGLNLDDLILLGITRSWLRGLLRRTDVRELQSTAWRFLWQEAQLAARSVEAERQEAANAPPLVADDVLRTFVAQLEAARSRIRKRVAPRLSEELGPLSLSEDPPVLIYHAPGLPWEPVAQTVQLPLEHWREEPLAPRCSCRAGDQPEAGGRRCRHALQAMDVLLSWVRRHEADEQGQKLSALLRQPAWARVLRAVGKLRVQSEPKRISYEDMRLGWKLDVTNGDVTLVPLLRKPLKKGGYSVGTRLSWEELGRSSDAWSPGDRRAIAALLPEGSSDIQSGLGMPKPRVYRALSRLAGSSEVQCANCGTAVTVKTVRLGMSARPAKGDAFTLGPSIGDEQLSFEELVRLANTQSAADLILRFKHDTHTLTLIEADEEALALARVFAERPVAFPAESYAELFQHAEALQERLPITLPPSVRGDEIDPEKTLVARLKPLPNEGLVAHILSRPLSGGSAFVPAAGPREVLGTLGSRRVHLRRDFEDEATRGRELVGKLGLRPETEGPDFTFTLEQGDEALDLVAKLQETDDPSLSVEWPERARRVSRPAQVKNLRMKVTQGKDWFGLEGDATVDEHRIELAVLLDALRKRRRYVEIRDGMWVALSDSLREKLTPLADQASGNEKSANLGLAGALAVEELASEVGEFEAVAGFSALLERIRTAKKWEPEAPPELAGILRDYQLSGFKWLARLASWGTGAVLADDMGLGKTIQALALLSQREQTGPALVIAPTSVCGNWIREARRFAPSLKPQLYREVPASQRGAFRARLGPGDLLITSYGLLVREAKSFAEIKLGTLVLDESQAIKNADTLRAKAARALQAEFKVALTGTPLENHLGELWSLYRVIFPGLFGSWDEFRDRYVRDEGTPEEDGKKRKNSPRAALARQVRPFLLRRTKQEVAPELPSRTEMEEHIELSPVERRLYEDARLAAVAKLTGATSQVGEDQRFEVLAALTRLRLCASHPALYDPNEKAPSSKLNRFLEIAGEIIEEGHRALVFSQFTKHLALVREALDKREIPYLYLDGQTPPAQRDELVDAFQAGSTPLFLISLKAGGTGLNLTGADYVIHMDPWWNPAVEDQATDRAHRIGQTRPVTVVRLVARGTIEEQILSLHSAKRTLVADVLAGSDAAAKVSTAELIDLIREGATIAQAEDIDSAEGDAVSVDSQSPPTRSGAAPPSLAPVTSPTSGRTRPGSAAIKAAPPETVAPRLPPAPPVAPRPGPVPVSVSPPPKTVSSPTAEVAANDPPESWLWSDGAEGRNGLQTFKEWMAQRVAASSAGVYAGAAKKLMTYAHASHAEGKWKQGDGLEALVSQYLDAVQKGPVAPSRSQASLVRAMVAQLRVFMARTRT